MKLFEILKKKTKIYPNKIALVIDEKVYTYETFYSLVVQTINNLSENKFDKNSKVIIVENNSLPYSIIIFTFIS